MSTDFELNAVSRGDRGKGASRRLRRQGWVPGIIYGAGKDPEAVSFEHRAVAKQLENEATYSHILNVKIGDRTERAILRALQRHPFKPMIMHIDLQRISADEKIRVQVPLHFVNEDKAPGVVEEGGVVSHLMNEVEISCLPEDLPEYIDVDLGELGMNESLYLSGVQLPEGVEILQFSHDEEYDAVVANIHHARAAAEPIEGEGEGEVEEGGEEDVE